MTSARGLDTDFAAAMQASHVDGFLLCEMALDSGTIYVVGLAFEVTWNGNTYLPVLGLGTVQEILETDSEVDGLTFTLAGVQESSIAIVLSEQVQGRSVVMRQVALKPDGTVMVDPLLWQGELDTMTLDDSGPTAVVTVTAEHKLAAWAEPNLLRYSDEDQQKLHPGDRFFQFAAAMAEATIVWPNKTFFKQ